MTGLPYVGVNHLEAHLYAAWLEEPDLEPPLAVLIVSGGHTMVVVMEDHRRYRIVGQTVDDAAGEAFDKVARYLGLGYPGGPAIDGLAVSGDAHAIDFPRAMRGEVDFSFAGLKTAVVNHVRHAGSRVSVADVAASFQEAVVDQLATKLFAAAADARASTLVLGGGVAANSRLRARVAEAATATGQPGVPPAEGALHRQRGDDRRGRLVAAAGRRPHSARRRRRPQPPPPGHRLTRRPELHGPVACTRAGLADPWHGWYLALALAQHEC